MSEASATIREFSRVAWIEDGVVVTSNVGLTAAIVLTDEGYACPAQPYPLREQAQPICAERLGEVDQTTFRAAASALTR